MNPIKVDYDPQVDILSIELSDRPIEDSSEVQPGIIVDYDEAGNIIGIEILDASKRVNPSREPL
jgi:uncharacterized protein YuzE